MIRGPQICVFCSASSDLDSRIIAEVGPFAAGLKERSGTMLYGGGASGLMGTFADASLKAGSPVRGAITKRLNDHWEVGHKGLTELKIVSDLFERKRWFIEESDAFLIYPGGFGTLDEALEVMTWKGLGELDKPIAFVNVAGFWDATLAAFENLASNKVIRAGGLESFGVVRTSREAWKWLDWVLGPKDS